MIKESELEKKTGDVKVFAEWVVSSLSVHRDGPLKVDSSVRYGGSNGEFKASFKHGYIDKKNVEIVRYETGFSHNESEDGPCNTNEYAKAHLAAVMEAVSQKNSAVTGNIKDASIEFYI